MTENSDISRNLKYAGNFPGVHMAELAWLERRREEAEVDKGDPENDAVGLALSGGGIRSATFNLGLLQALERHGILKRIDYLSTVSGGGFIGSSLTWFKAKCQEEFPFGTKRVDNRGIAGNVVAWLRSHGKYLTPGGGMNTWSLIAAILTGSIINLAIFIPVFLFSFHLLSLRYFTLPTWPDAPDFLAPLNGLTIDGFGLFMIACLVSLVLFLYHMARLIFTSSIAREQGIVSEKRTRGLEGKALMFLTLFGAVGTIPVVFAWFSDWIHGVMSSITFSGVVMLIGAMWGRKGGNEAKGWRSLVLSIGFACLTYGLFLWFHYLTGGERPIVGMWWIVVGLAVAFVLSIVANINHVSMHRFYRNRLMEAYMPYEIAGAKSDKCDRTDTELKGSDRSPWYPYSNLKDADRFYLCDIPITDSPYQIVNTNMQTVGSEDRKLRGRGGDSFFFTPLYCGAESTGYAPTKTYVGGAMSLATAFSISGAAVDSNTFATRSRPVSFLMSLLNIRLGYWINNPVPPRFWKLESSRSRPWWFYYMVKEMIGLGLDETNANLHLSDGGHFENLGLYELIRRKCRRIIVSDAGADADYNFGDLARAIEMVRLDFGAEIDLKVDDLRPSGKSELSARPYKKGTITYRDGSVADLWFIKTTLIKDLPEDVNSYGRVNPQFPDQTTADQFFDEPQFEAYRELGYQVGKRLCEDDDCEKLKVSTSVV